VICCVPLLPDWISSVWPSGSDSLRTVLLLKFDADFFDLEFLAHTRHFDGHWLGQDGKAGRIDAVEGIQFLTWAWSSACWTVIPGEDWIVTCLLSARMVMAMVVWAGGVEAEQPVKAASRTPRMIVRRINFTKDRNLPLKSGISAQLLPG